MSKKWSFQKAIANLPNPERDRDVKEAQRLYAEAERMKTAADAKLQSHIDAVIQSGDTRAMRSLAQRLPSPDLKIKLLSTADEIATRNFGSTVFERSLDRSLSRVLRRYS